MEKSCSKSDAVSKTPAIDHVFKTKKTSVSTTAKKGMVDVLVSFCGKDLRPFEVSLTFFATDELTSGTI
jgi:hypothetical protein